MRLVKRSLGQKQQELEAETVSFLVCRHLGLRTQSLEYLAGYLTQEEWQSFSYETVIKVADRLLGLVSAPKSEKTRGL